MRRPPNPGYHSLGALSRAIREEIEQSFSNPLRLAGDAPNEWPDRDTTEHARLIRRVKSGLLFYSMEDFLWPNKRDSDPIDIWVGHTLRRSARHGRNPHIHLHKLSEERLPNLAEVLWTPRRPDVQPVALRTYAEALIYGRAGALLERRFLPLITSQWRVREHLLEPSKIPPEFHQRFRFKELFYLGDYPSRVTESMAAEIQYALGGGRSEDDETRYGLYAPPEARLKKAHARQVERLVEKWRSRNDKSNTRPCTNWVRCNLIDFLPGEQDISGFVNDDWWCREFGGNLKLA